MINSLWGAALNAACVQCRTKGPVKCKLYGNVEEVDRTLEWEIMDIEDLHKLSEDWSVCTYYLTKSRAGRADIVFMPYNYLIDEKIWENFEIDYANSVIIIDEAHNIAGSCEEVASKTISESVLEHSITELSNLYAIITKPSWTDSEGG